MINKSRSRILTICGIVGLCQICLFLLLLFWFPGLTPKMKVASATNSKSIIHGKVSPRERGNGIPIRNVKLPTGSNFPTSNEAGNDSVPVKLPTSHDQNTRIGSMTDTELIASTNNSDLTRASTLRSQDRNGSRQVINPHGYSLLIDQPQACLDAAGAPREVFLLVLVTSFHTHIEQRQAIRQTWGSLGEVRGKDIVTLFLFGYSGNASLQRQLEKESRKHHDVLQEDFQDAYRNLTLKTIMGMKWATTHCPQASYVMKTDDDMYISYNNLIKLLTNAATPSTNYAVGYRFSKGRPFRDPASKWYMPKKLFPHPVYPPYVAGGGYVLSNDVVRNVFEKSLGTRYLPIEDVFVGVCLKLLNVQPIGNKDFYLRPIKYSRKRYKTLITSHGISPAEMHGIWNDQQAAYSVSLSDLMGRRNDFLLDTILLQLCTLLQGTNTLLHSHLVNELKGALL
ncbi:beta-1,3-galactosyltransferase 1-like [Acanthaster planci]|uniref:Hexosyltransferase n=1 Tax=Acanthaster planci TaxID=133434 RepID=A0A8B7Y1B5_ACAPL|nr:beta-1,3-galactosyltransferase 1-like [Acanthaster planci]XP_022086318.1 beta-1,3-galactosyltransferase 1-like [Acanthaster planci]XP_022086319.1 beta-1,3-galactosyltransferase 1-like [Acanthaster planci]